MNNTQTIKTLRQSGWKVAVHRSINCKTTTRIVVTDPQGKHSQGHARTCPTDVYNRKLGNKIALGRALDNYNKSIYCDFKLGVYNE